MSLANKIITPFCRASPASKSGHLASLKFWIDLELIALGTAKDLGIPIITLTQFGQNPLAKLSNVCLQTSRPTKQLTVAPQLDSILAQFITIDLLFYVYISHNKENAEKIYSTRAVVKEYRKNIFSRGSHYKMKIRVKCLEIIHFTRLFLFLSWKNSCAIVTI